MHFIELEDQPWFPVTIRDLATDYLHFIETALKLDGMLAPLVARALTDSRTMRIVDLVWIIGPILRKDGTTLHWLDVAMVLGMGGVWLTMFFANLGGRALVPAHDPYFKEAMANVGH